jgi:hypothetical protein
MMSSTFRSAVAVPLAAAFICAAVRTTAISDLPLGAFAKITSAHAEAHLVVANPMADEAIPVPIWPGHVIVR